MKKLEELSLLEFLNTSIGDAILVLYEELKQKELDDSHINKEVFQIHEVTNSLYEFYVTFEMRRPPKEEEN